MSSAELAYRVQQAARATHDRLANTHESAVPAPALPRKRFAFVHVPEALDPSPYVAAAERILQGRMPIFALDDAQIGCPPQWNRDPLTGRVAPLQTASSLDYRDERVVGNIKYLWEPNRHLHLPLLAQAYALTGSRAYAEALRAQLESWFEQCPPGRGPNWCSSLELGIRLINWSIAWQLLGGFDAPLFADAGGRAFRTRWLDSVYRHARAIMRKLSRFSSANNHLIGETAGVFVAAMTWNCWPQMHAWGAQAKEILGREMLIQNAEDGGNREQAFAYQQFVLDFALLAGLAARASGDDFAHDYWACIERMIQFLAAVMDAEGHVPMVGDADDGYVVRLAPFQESFDNYHSLLATGALLFERSDFAAKAAAIDHKTLWLTGSEAAKSFEHFQARASTATLPRAFPSSGYYILGSEFDTAEEIRLLADAGPLGYLSIAAHGHADALGIVLSVGGEEVLVDPGTYAYHTEPEWRRYFRSTRAHNTVLVDGLDQSLQSGNFMWSRHAEARCLQFDPREGLQRFVGEHNGYCSLRDPVRHRREILYDEPRRLFTISDTLEGADQHDFSLHWHFAESCAPVLAGAEVRAQTKRYVVRVVPESAVQEIKVYRGGSATQGGWVSRSFGRKDPATTVEWKATMSGTTTFRTRIYIEES